jgi:S-DNA-T family DNA segregation ATPase FtsK/SpoIIIE
MPRRKSENPEPPLSRADRVWAELTGALLVLLALFLVASMVSFNLRAQANLGGKLGVFLSTVLFAGLGLAAYLAPFLLIALGVCLVRFSGEARARIRAMLATSAFTLALGAWTVGALDYVAGRLHFLGPAAREGMVTPEFSPGGNAGEALAGWLRDLAGPVGAAIFLVAYALIFLVVFTPIRHRFGDWLRGLLAAIRRLGQRKIEPEKPRVIAGQPAVRSAVIPPRQIIGPEPEPGPETGTADTPPVFVERKSARPVQPPPLRRITGQFTFDPQEFLDLLYEPTEDDEPVKDRAEAEQEAQLLLGKMREFGIDGKIGSIYSGPVITRFEFTPAPGIKIQRVENLADDLALSLRAERIRILAPIPGKSAVGIEIPNRERKMVFLRKVLTSHAFADQTSPLGFALGESITGEPNCADLSTMPHVLIAGTTGSGKSVCVNTLVSSIIFRSSYEDVRFLTIDPKRLELPIYDPIPHLLFPTTVNSKEAVQKLDYVIGIMEHRYRDFAKVGARDIAGYNAKAGRNGVRKKPYIVVIIDELADLMITAPSEIEEKITRLAQMSRAVGIHLVLATQRPSVDVITGLIKANFPCRIAFQVASKTDSRTILDMNGAEALLGKGDMLFLPPGKGEPARLHGAFISAEETQNVVKLLARRYLVQLLTGLLEPPRVEAAAQEIVESELYSVLLEPGGVAFEERKRRLSRIIPENVVDNLIAGGYYQKLEESLPLPGTPEAEAADEERELDEFFGEAAKIVVRHQEASVSMLQRRLDVGWARAGRIIDQLERAGVVGPYVGSKSRKVLVENDGELNNLLAAGSWFGLRVPESGGDPDRGDEGSPD